MRKGQPNLPVCGHGTVIWPVDTLLYVRARRVSFVLNWGKTLRRNVILRSTPSLFLLLLSALWLRNEPLAELFGLSEGVAATIFRQGLEALIWIFGAALFNQFMRYVVYDRLVAGALEGPVPEVLKTLTAVLVYLLVATAIVGIVYDESVTAFLAALGASGVVLGFALRSLIADVFTGLAINLDRSFVIGDWVQVNEGVSGVVIGQITEIGWRCTSLTTEEQTNVVVPNGMLGVERMVNITRPAGATRFEFSVTVEFSVPPQRVKRVLMAAMRELEEVPGFVLEKTPVVLIKDTSALGVEYLLRYWIYPWGPISPTSAEDRVYSAVLKHLHTAGIGLAYPKQDLYMAEMPVRQFDGHHHEDLAKILRQTALFKPLSDQETEDIAGDMRRQHLQPGSTLVRQGEQGDSLYVLLEGLLDVYVATDTGEERVGRIHPGECFGEMSLLTGEQRTATIRTTVESVVYEVRKPAIRDLMERRPALAELLANLLAERQLGTELALHDSEHRQDPQEVEGFARQLVVRMREFLDLRLHTSSSSH